MERDWDGMGLVVWMDRRVGRKVLEWNGKGLGWDGMGWGWWYGWIIAFDDGVVRLCAIKKGYGRYDGGYR
jgi:hypothetical protein